MQRKVYQSAKMVVSTACESLRVAQPRNMVVTMISNPDENMCGAEFIMTEKVYTPRPDRQWTNRSKTLHLTLKTNAQHVQVQGYISREDFKSNHQLGDLLCLEAEQLADALEDTESLASESAQ